MANIPEEAREKLEHKIGEFSYSKPYDNLDDGERVTVRFVIDDILEWFIPLIEKRAREKMITELEKHIELTEEGRQIIVIGEDSHLATKEYKWYQALKGGK